VKTSIRVGNITRLAVALTISLTLIGCGGSTPGMQMQMVVQPASPPLPTSPPPVVVPLADQNWHFSSNSAPNAIVPFTIDTSLGISGAILGGVAHLQLNNCFVLRDGVPFSGSIDHNNEVIFTIGAGSKGTVSIDVVLSADGASMDGRYTIRGGCADGYTGSLNGVKVKPLVGHYSGTFTKGTTTVSATAQLTQSATADGSSGYFQVSGEVNVAGANCPATLQLNGAIMAGRVVYLYSSTESGLEALVGTMDADAHQIQFDDYYASDDCIAGYSGTLVRQ
jgi:hypothetical protein